MRHSSQTKPIGYLKANVACPPAKAVISGDPSQSIEGLMSTTLSVNGQVTIPKQIRDALGLKPGMPVDFTEKTLTVVLDNTTGMNR